MQSVDGDVRLSVGLDTQNVKKNVNDLGRSIKTTLNQFGEAKGVDALSAKARQIGLNVEKAANKVADLRSKLDEAKKSAVDKIVNSSAISKQIEEVKRKIAVQNEFLSEAQQIAASLGLSESETAERTKSYTSEIERLTAQLDNLTSKLNDYKNEAETIAVASKGYQDIQGKLVEAEKEYDAATQKVKEFNETQKQSSSAGFKANFEKVAAITKTVLNKAGKYFKSFTSVAKSAFKRVASLAKSAFKSITDHAKNSSKNAGNAITNINGAVRKGLKTLLRYGLGIRGLFMLFRKLRSAVSEGLKNLVQYSDEVNADISSLMSAFTKLKNALATMFQPLIKIVAPILTTLINKASQVATSIGKVIAAFAGQNYVYEAVDVQEDYAKSLDKTSKSAKNAEKALDNYLSPLDDINKFQEASSTSEDDDGAVDPSQMFKTSAIEGRFTKLANKLKEILKSNDWTSLGKFVGDKLNNILGGIDWNSIQQKAKDFATRLFTLLNGFIAEVDWNLVGTTILNGIKTALTAVSTFLQGFDFSALGKAFGAIINQLASPETAKMLAETLSSLVSGVFSAIISLINTIDWGKVSDTIISLISNFDFSKISGLAIKLLNSIATALQNIKFDAIGKAFSDGLSKIDWRGVWKSAVTAAGSLMKGIGKLFGLDINTSKAEKAFKNLAEPVEKLLGAFKTLAEGVLPLITNNLLPTAVKLIGDVFQGISPIVSALTPIISSALGAVDRIVSALSPVLVTIGDSVGKILETLSPILDIIFDLVAQVAENLAPALDDVLKLVGAIFEVAKPFVNIIADVLKPINDVIGSWIRYLGGLIKFITGVFSGDWSQAWDGIKQTFVSAFETLKNSAKVILEAVVAIFKAAWEDIKLAWNGVKGFFVGIWNGITSVFDGVAGWFGKIFTDTVDAIKKAWSGVTDFFSKLWQGIWEVIKTPINWIIDGINTIIGGLNSLAIDVPDWVPFVGGQHWGISIPEVPKLAQGAVIPPNQEFLAVLGDQKRGNNIEAPEGLIRKIIREELANSQSSGNVYEVPLVVGRKTLAKLVIDEAKLMLSQTGKNPFDLIPV